MARAAQVFRGAAAVFGGAVNALFGSGLRRPLDLDPGFADDRLPDDLDAYLAASEAKVRGIVPGTEKRILWAGQRGMITDYAVVYLHGFSATSQEIRPVPDSVAQALGANLHFMRYAGHGLPGAELAGPTAQDWMHDTAEALAIGRRIGRKVIVISTSTGGTLAAEAALRPEMIRDVAGIVFISPNFGIRARAAALLSWPLARYWAPWVAGAERCFAARGADHARYWTICYPTIALLPMAALARHAARQNYGHVATPALFVFTEADQVVSAAATARVAAGWGAAVAITQPVLGPGDDEYSHVIAGDILSPHMSAPVSARILEWVRALAP